MEFTGDEGSSQNAVPSISIEIKTPNSNPREEEDVKPASSRVHESLGEERPVCKNKFSLDKESNDQRVLPLHHHFASCTGNLVKTRNPSKFKKLEIKLKRPQERRDYHKGRVNGKAKCERFLDNRGHSKIPPNSTSVVNKGGHSRNQEEPEYDEDMIEAAEALLMLSRGRPSMAESSGNRR